jgi:hypothetical protein
MMSEAFSAIMIVGALVLHEGTKGPHGGVDRPQAVDPAKLEIWRHDLFGPAAHRAQVPAG